MSEQNSRWIDEPITSDVKARILQAQAGSLEAYAALRRQYAPLIRTSLAKYENGDMSMQEREDLREEAEHVFLSALSSYDTGQEEVSFGLYAKVCLHNGLVSELRHQNALRRVRDAAPRGDEMPQREDPSDLLLEKERFARLCELVKGCLSEYENHIWWAYVAGIPVGDIAATLGRDERSVHNAIYRIRRKLRRRLSEEKQAGTE